MLSDLSKSLSFLKSQDYFLTVSFLSQSSEREGKTNTKILIWTREGWF